MCDYLKRRRLLVYKIGMTSKCCLACEPALQILFWGKGEGPGCEREEEPAQKLLCFDSAAS